MHPQHHHLTQNEKKTTLVTKFLISIRLSRNKRKLEMAKIALVLILCSCLQIANAHFLASNATWKENLEVRLFGEEAGDNRRLEAEDEMVYPTVIPEDEDELEDLIDDETDFEDEPDGPDVADARRLSNDFELTWEYIMDENNVEGPLLDYLVVGAGISGVSSGK